MKIILMLVSMLKLFGVKVLKVVKTEYNILLFPFASFKTSMRSSFWVVSVYMRKCTDRKIINNKYPKISSILPSACKQFKRFRPGT